MVTPKIVRALLNKLSTYSDPTVCWIWLGPLDKQGRPSCKIGNGYFKPQRIVYEYCVGPIPENRSLYRTCPNEQCCNPYRDHSYVGSNGMGRRIGKLKKDAKRDPFALYILKNLGETIDA